MANAAVKFKSEDFRLIQTIGAAQIAFLARKDLPANSVDEFLDYARKMGKEGKIKILAMLNNERLEAVKQYPAISESKQLKNFNFTIWTGYFVKKDTPEPVVQILHKAVTESLNDPVVRTGLETNSLLVAKPLPLADLNKLYADGTAQFRAIAKSINLQPQ
jgi:tripartite-type tricarboxylate transporter receptor subunit TctC